MNHFRHTTPESVRRGNNEYDMVNSNLSDGKSSNLEGFEILRRTSVDRDDDFKKSEEESPFSNIEG